jgi:hypothetical protein
MRFNHPRMHKCYVTLAASLLLFSLSCDGVDPPTRKAIGALASLGNGTKSASPAPAERSITTDDLIVYIDTSSPMKGYVSADGQSIFSRTLRTLREFATTLDPPVNVRLRTVDSVVGPARSNTAISEASTNPAFYTGTETNLAEAIAYFAESERITGGPADQANGQNKDQPALNSENPPPQPIKTARFHILVTDGVQYSRQQNQDMHCASGSDAYCVRKKLLELMAGGWAGAIIGLRSQFCCSFFSEMSQRPVAYDTRKLEPKDYRPFYLFIFSPDHEALDKLVARFKESLRDTLDNKTLSLRELALTPKYAADKFVFNDADFRSGEKTKLSCKKVDDALPLYLSFRLREEAKAVRVPFELAVNIPWTDHALDCGSPKELTQLLKWELLSAYPTEEATGYRYPEVSIDFNNAQVDDSGRVVFQAEAIWPKAAGKSAWRAYRLVGRLNQESHTPIWVREWSTDIDTRSETGNRTLNLTTALLGIWRNPILKEQVVADLYLRVGPQ